MNFWSQFWWVIFPYLMLATFVVGHIYRYNTDQYGWTAKSSEFLEKEKLKWGSILFHYGLLLVFGGHVVGLLVPKELIAALGISDELYHTFAMFAGGTSGLITLTGLLILLFRRVNVKRVRVTSSISDFVIAGLLLIVVGLGVYNSLTFNFLSPASSDYRETIAPWLRGLIVFRPDASLMEGVPISRQLHTLAAFGILGIWPFTRLVHVWSVPYEYLQRSYIIYRSRRKKGHTDLRKAA